ncbi:MAG: GGDEF domain-containing protein [Candidatus Aenigmarchaeota archaeon]|nr:GGDEF domain-containing protein [Candidatus Aenigmarchaeota archaeon]
MEKWEELELPEELELTEELKSLQNPRSREVLSWLIRAAILDPLTTLDDEHPVYNRRGFMQDMRQYFGAGLPDIIAQRIGGERRQTSDGHDSSLFLFDLYNFGETNHRIGHDGADLVLQYMAKGVLVSARRRDRVYRPGGDEFAVILRIPYPIPNLPDYPSPKTIVTRTAHYWVDNAHLLPEGAKPFGFYGGLVTSLEAYESGLNSGREVFKLADTRLNTARSLTYRNDESTIIGENEKVIFSAPIIKPVLSTL